MTTYNSIYPPVINSSTGHLNYSNVTTPLPTLPPNGPIYTINNTTTGPSITSNLTQSALTVMGTNGNAVVTFHTDGRIETQGGTINAKDLTAVIKLMKRMMTDIANDEELSVRFPYIKDAAHEWVMDELRK